MARTSETTDVRRQSRPHQAWSALVGLTSLGVLLQGLWAGLFLRGDADGSTWVSVHQHGAEATITLALLAAVAGAVWLRHRRDLLVGTVLLALFQISRISSRAEREPVPKGPMDFQPQPHGAPARSSRRARRAAAPPRCRRTSPDPSAPPRRAVRRGGG